MTAATLRRVPLAGAVVVAALWAYGPGADGAAAAVWGLVLLALSLHDAATREIPLRYTLGGTLAALLWAAASLGLAAAGMRALAAAGVAAGLWVLSRGVGALAGREVMGEGDALLLAFLSAVVGLGRIGALLTAAATLALAVFAARLLPAPWRGPAAWIAAGIASAAFLAGGWARLGALALPLAAIWPRRHLAAEPLPFGPMLAAGAVLALFAPSISPAPHAASVHAPLFPQPAMKLLRTLLVPAALLAATAAAAQRPVSAGTTAALGGTGVTEARRADALLFNPALLGLWDGGPASSRSFLALDLARLPSRGTFDGAVRLGLIGGEVGGGSPYLEYSGPLGDASYPGALGGVTWGGFQNRELALSLSTHATAYADIPPAIREALGAGDAESPATGESGRSLATVLALGRALSLGSLPGIGPVWAGATAKGWYLHTHARGSFVADAPGADVYRETVFRGVPGYGVDLGIAASPGRVRLAASVANAFAGMVRPGAGPRERVVSVSAGANGRATVSEELGPEIDFGDLGTEPFAAASRAWQDVYFPSVLRAGAAWDAEFGTVALAASQVVRGGGLEPPGSTERFTAGFRGTARLPLRASYGWGEGARSYSLGLDAGSCARRWTLAAARRTGPRGTSMGLAASLRLMDGSCATR